LKVLRPEQFLQVTGPVHAAIERGFAAGDLSAWPARLPVGHPTVSSAFRRLTRPRGPVAKRMNQIDPRSFGDSTAARTVLQGMGAIVTRGGDVQAQKKSLDAAMSEVQAMKTMLLAQLDPKVTVLEAIRKEMPSAASTDLLRFAPEFSQPMYEPLRDYFQ